MHEPVRDDRQQHALAPRDGGTDGGLVRVAIVEVEMNQGRVPRDLTTECLAN